MTNWFAEAVKAGKAALVKDSADLEWDEIDTRKMRAVIRAIEPIIRADEVGRHHSSVTRTDLCECIENSEVIMANALADNEADLRDRLAGRIRYTAPAPRHIDDCECRDCVVSNVLRSVADSIAQGLL